MSCAMLESSPGPVLRSAFAPINNRSVEFIPSLEPTVSDLIRLLEKVPPATKFMVCGSSFRGVSLEDGYLVLHDVDYEPECPVCHNFLDCVDYVIRQHVH